MYPLPPQVNTALTLLNTAGFEAFVVGGAVRDLLRGSPVHDWDITTSALPEQTKAVFAGYRLIETGIRHGTVTVLCDGQAIEVTTYRIDGSYSDGRHPDAVTFSSDLTEDLKRRDFTINAMAMTLDGQIIDPFGGSGTTAVSAKKFDRHFIYIDNSEMYCEMARKRIDGEEWQK